MIGIRVNNKPLDLFGDETITLNSRVKDINDISKVLTDYTYSFTVPASNNNNEIFSHYYRAAVLGEDFRFKQRASITLDGIPYRDGFIQLLDIKMKMNKPESYQITFLGTAIALATEFGKDTLKDLNWDDFNGELTAVKISDGIRTGGSLFSDRMIVPLIQREFDTPLEKWTSDVLAAGVDYTKFFPAVRVDDIFNRIQAHYGFTFQGTFLSSTAITQLYYWFSNTFDPDANSVITTPFGVLLDWPNEAGNVQRFIGSDIVINAANSERYVQVIYTITPTNLTIPYKVTRESISNGGNSGFEYTNTTGVFTITEQFDNANDDIGSIRLYISTDALNTFTWEATVNQRRNTGQAWAYDADADGGATIDDFTKSFIWRVPEIPVVDFVTNIVKMFNLVVIYIDDVNFYLDTYDNYLQSGVIKDLTRYIDISEHTVQVGKIPSSINFKYEDPKAAGNKEFKGLTGIGYGDADISTGGLGDEIAMDVTFENLLWDRLEGNSVHQVAFACDSKGTRTDGHHLLYWGQDMAGANIVVTGQPAITSYKMCGTFSPATSTAVHSLNFDSELNPYTALDEQASLYSGYYKNFLNAQLNRQQRLYRFSAVMSPREIAELKLNDVIKLHDAYFTIDNITANLLTRRTDFELKNLIREEAPPATLIDTEPPTKVTLFEIPRGLKWTPAKDNVAVKGYEIWYNSSGNTYTLYMDAGNTLTMRVKGGKYKVRAYDTSMNYGNFSNIIQVNP